MCFLSANGETSRTSPKRTTYLHIQNTICPLTPEASFAEFIAKAPIIFGQRGNACGWTH